jgi:parallel beta-helix repeat protein
MRALGVALTTLLTLTGCPSDDDDGPVDTGTADTGVADTGVTDTGAADTGAPDTGQEMDAGEMDTGPIDTGVDPFVRISCAGVGGTCLEFTEEQETDLLDALNALGDGTTIVLGAGTFDLDNALTIRGANGVTLTGQGIDVTILDFSTQTTQSNGVDVVGDDFSISHVTIVDSKKDGLRIEDSRNVRIQFVKATWSGGPSTMNGSYGIYPVRCVNVLMEDCEATNASDAGLYVGQSINVVVRRNVARQNVAGLEIENTQFADVYENIVEDNTGGLLIFDLPGNPVVGRDIQVHDNTIRMNNRLNFAPSGSTVSQIPAGTGTFTLASRRVEIANNTYASNDTTDIAVVSGLAIQSSTAAWAIPLDMVGGSTVGLNLPIIGNDILNFPTTEIWIHGNSHSMSGTLPDGRDTMARPLGALLSIVYFFRGMGPVDSVLYDGIGEMVDPVVPANNTNLNHICVEGETGATFAVLDLPALAAMLDMGMFPSTDDIYQPDPPYVPFDCTGFTAGPIPDVVLPF